MMVVTIVLVLVAAGAGFFGGMKYADVQRTQARGNGNRQFPGMTNGQTQGRNQMAGRPVTGEVISKDDTSITVKPQDGGSKIVLVSATTIVSKTTDGSIEDIAVGENVGVFGTENSDKSMTAQNIQLNPQFRMGGSSPTPTK